MNNYVILDERHPHKGIILTFRSGRMIQGILPMRAIEETSNTCTKGLAVEPCMVGISIARRARTNALAANTQLDSHYAFTALLDKVQQITSRYVELLQCSMASKFVSINSFRFTNSLHMTDIVINMRFKSSSI